MPTLKDIASRLNLDISTVSKILRRVKGSSFPPETIKKVFNTARKLGYDIEKRIRFRHRRKAPRIKVDIPADIKILTIDGELFDKGTAVIKEISLVGARISDVELPKGVLPLKKFEVVLIPKTNKIKGCIYKGVLSRVITDEKLEFGVCFTTLDSDTIEKTKQMS